MQISEKISHSKSGVSHWIALRENQCTQKPSARNWVRAVHAAQTEPRLFQQPPGHPTHFPFRADVGAGPQDHVQSQPLRQQRKGGEVPFVLPFKNAFLRLMQVPGI